MRAAVLGMAKICHVDMAARDRPGQAYEARDACECATSQPRHVCAGSPHSGNRHDLAVLDPAAAQSRAATTRPLERNITSGSSTNVTASGLPSSFELKATG